MSKKSGPSRLQVLVEKREYRRLQSRARSRGLSMGAWVRDVLRQALQGESPRSPTDKIAAIRRGAALNFPTADIEQMNAEITAGYLTDDLR